MIRFSLIYFGIGMTLGGIMLWNKGMPISASIWQLLPMHIELLLFGWVMQLVMGVAFWIMPRYSVAPRYGRVNMAWIAFILFNIGLWAVLIQSQWLILIGRVVMFVSVALFALYLFPRVKPYGA
jgi:heme/copper-type cytochrome/quinol oxidase subunit 1